MMRAPWMALLCAVFVSLCPLPVDAGCSDCEIELFRPTLNRPWSAFKFIFTYWKAVDVRYGLILKINVLTN